MGVNELTLSIINEYIEATGQGLARRANLTPEEYLLFRAQAIKEIGQNPVPVAQTIMQPQMPKVETRKEELPSVTNTLSHTSHNVEPMANNVQTETFLSIEDDSDDDDDMLALLKSVPG